MKRFILAPNLILLLLLGSAFGKDGEARSEDDAKVFSASLKLLGGADISKTDGERQQGGATFSEGEGRLRIDLTERLRWSLYGSFEGEYNTLLKAATVELLTDLTQAFSPAWTGTMMAGGNVSCGNSPYENTFSGFGEFRTEIDLTSAVTAEGGYETCLIHYLHEDRRDHRHRIHSGISWFSLSSPLLLLQLDGAVEYLASTDRSETALTGLVSLQFHIDYYKTISFNIFCQFRYDDFRSAGWASTLLTVGETEVFLTAAFSWTTEISFTFAEASDAKDDLVQFTVLSGLSLSL